MKLSYVQDERYIAIEHMDEVRPRSGREGALGYVRRDCVNFAQCFLISMGAKVVWSLFQDMPQARPCGRGLDILSRTVLKQGPHPLGSVGNLKTVVSDRRAPHTTEAGVGLYLFETIAQ